jgi:hypothetical protein
MPKKIIPAISQDTLTLIGVLKTLKDPALTISKAELDRAIGRNCSSLMMTATRHLRTEDGLVVEYDRPHGVYRGMHGEKNLNSRRKSLGSIRRRTRREAEKLGCIDFTALGDAQKIEAAAVASTLGALHQFTSPQSQKKIESSIQKAEASGMSFGRTIALFHENGNKD